MDAAEAAAMSDPELNRWFRRVWKEVDAEAIAPVVVKPAAEAAELIGHDLLVAWRRERAACAVVLP